jgi:hypothetical protein
MTGTAHRRIALLRDFRSRLIDRSLRQVQRIQVPEKQATRPKRRLLRERNFQVLKRHLLKSVCLLNEKRFVQRLAVLRSVIKEDVPNSFSEDQFDEN